MTNFILHHLVYHGLSRFFRFLELSLVIFLFVFIFSFNFFFGAFPLYTPRVLSYALFSNLFIYLLHFITYQKEFGETLQKLIP